MFPLDYVYYVNDIVYNIPKGIQNLLFTKTPAVSPSTFLSKNSPMIIPSSSRGFIRLAGFSGALAVVLGAYGAHALQKDFPAELKEVYQTANRYHFIHTIALLAVPFCRKPKLVGSLLIMGNIIFSGTCYYYALTGSKSIRQYTPYGGILLIAGWLAMIL